MIAFVASARSCFISVKGSGVTLSASFRLTDMFFSQRDHDLGNTLQTISSATVWRTLERSSSLCCPTLKWRQSKALGCFIDSPSLT